MNPDPCSSLEMMKNEQQKTCNILVMKGSAQLQLMPPSLSDDRLIILYKNFFKSYPKIISTVSYFNQYSVKIFCSSQPFQQLRMIYT